MDLSANNRTPCPPNDNSFVAEPTRLASQMDRVRVLFPFILTSKISGCYKSPAKTANGDRDLRYLLAEKSCSCTRTGAFRQPDGGYRCTKPANTISRRTVPASRRRRATSTAQPRDARRRAQHGHLGHEGHRSDRRRRHLINTWRRVPNAPPSSGGVLDVSDARPGSARAAPLPSRASLTGQPQTLTL